jgi:hypothetical protein
MSWNEECAHYLRKNILLNSDKFNLRDRET